MKYCKIVLVKGKKVRSEFMFCSKCGTKNESGAKFCEKCGSKLEDIIKPNYPKKENKKILL